MKAAPDGIGERELSRAIQDHWGLVPARLGYLPVGFGGHHWALTDADNRPGKPISTGQMPTAIPIAPDGTTVYVANADSGTVTPISTATNQPGKPIKVGGGPDAIAITADGTIAYVANYYSGTVTPIRTATGTTERSIQVGRGPAAIAIKP